VDAARIAERAGAGRLELCENLDVGGTTPSPQLLTAVRAAVRIPISAMVRPRGGSYVHPRPEVDVMLHQIDEVRALGADMVVVGVLTHAGVARVLTSGGAPTAVDGADQLHGLVAHAAGRIVIMAGGRVRPNNAR